MAYITEVSHTQTTTGNRDFSVTFPFMSTADLRVQLAGVTKSLTTDYTIVQSGANTVVNFNTAPADNAVVRIFRDTDIDAIKSTYQSGSSIRATDLNENNTQLLYAAQEFGTLKDDNSVSFSLGDKGDIQVNSSSDWTIQNNTIAQAQMADNSVGTNEIIDGNITGEKLASLAITAAQLAANAVITAKINNDAVTADKIADNAVGTLQIADDAVNPTKINQTAAAGYGFNPPGSVIWYAGNTAPTGYLKANGDSIPNGSGTVQGVAADYSGLYAIVGGSLPDLRGEFIRGWDDGRNIDGSRAIRSTQSQQAESHNHVATTGTDGSHTHTASSSENGAHTHNTKVETSPDYDGNQYDWMHEAARDDDDGTNVATSSAGAHTHTITVDTTNSVHTHNISVQNQVGGGTETRPRNVALLACIKY